MIRELHKKLVMPVHQARRDADAWRPAGEALLPAGGMIRFDSRDRKRRAYHA
jgi:hypothetical protein